MHTSLDSALGSPHRPNSVGESVLLIAPSAAAAYSLRSLTGGDPKAVRVRRDTDNAEQDFTVSEINSGALVTFVGSGNNGFVETWYDQSGVNHATQTTDANQPKIVSSGSLLTDGITFDGTNDRLQLTSTLGITSVASHFVVANLNDTGSADTLFDNRDGGTSGYSIRTNDASNINFDWSTSDAEVARASGEGLYYFNKTSSQVQSGTNGGTLVTASQSSSISVTTVPKIGARSFSSATNFYEGSIQELIIYASDQTDNRVAVEANIINHYGIS